MEGSREKKGAIVTPSDARAQTRARRCVRVVRGARRAAGGDSAGGLLLQPNFCVLFWSSLILVSVGWVGVVFAVNGGDRLDARADARVAPAGGGRRRLCVSDKIQETPHASMCITSPDLFVSYIYGHLDARISLTRQQQGAAAAFRRAIATHTEPCSCPAAASAQARPRVNLRRPAPLCALAAWAGQSLRGPAGSRSWRTRARCGHAAAAAVCVMQPALHAIAS